MLSVAPLRAFPQDGHALDLLLQGLRSVAETAATKLRSKAERG